MSLNVEGDIHGDIDGEVNGITTLIQLSILSVKHPNWDYN